MMKRINQQLQVILKQLRTEAAACRREAAQCWTTNDEKDRSAAAGHFEAAADRSSCMPQRSCTVLDNK
jgi:dsDNA-specific endonuclease/ATPase MutS2